MKRNFKSAVVFSVCSLAIMAARANLIVNGGFETGDFTGWTLSGNTTETFVAGAVAGLGAPHSGSYQAFLGAVGGLGDLSQSVATVSGQSYQVEFWVSDAVAYVASEFYAKWGGTTLMDEVNPSKSGYTEYTFDVTGNGSPTSLEFGFRHDASFFLLDDVSVSAIPTVPEPSTYEAAIGAFSLVVFGTLLKRVRR
jgi:hypothetical protein